jgi:leucyl aminopeptidase
MRFNVVTRQPWDVPADVLVVPLQADEAVPEALAELDRRAAGAIGAMRERGAIRGKCWEARLLPGADTGAEFVLTLGVGDDPLDELAARRLGAAAVRQLSGVEVAHLALYLPDAVVGAAGSERIAELVVRGIVEGGHEPSTIYREEVERLPPVPDEVTLVVESGDVETLRGRAERGAIVGEGGNRTRRLAHRAANDISPEVLADEASDLARAHGLELTVLGPEEAAELGMGMFMAVGKGSANPPRFIALRNRPEQERDASGRLMTLVGKGVTFDTGGISLKPPPRMGEMKTDKTGACTVISAIATAAQLAPGQPLLAVAPAVENMPGPNSTRPGDVVRAMNGKTVEIDNTDAEGRLILGDALTWAEQQGATHIVDVATLTGAMARALGRYVTGGFGGDDGWWDEVAQAAARQGEPLWRMPLVADLRKDIDSPFADMANTGPGEGGAITAALFLQEFVTVPWVHLDIAGTAYLSKVDPFSTKGATGVMHATLVELVAG